MSEFRSSSQYKQQRAFQVSGDVRSLICFCVDTSGSMTERLGYWDSRTKINLLSDVLKNMIVGFRSDPKMRHAVAISIVTYNKFAQIKEPFQDAAVYEDLSESCSFDDVDRNTNMTNGLNVSLRAIREIQQEMIDHDQSSHVPLLVFMTDGEPVGDDYYLKKFEDIRDQVSNKRLHIFPVGIGSGANMRLISYLFPQNEVPHDFMSRYCMQTKDDFVRVFDDIRRIIYEQNNNFTDEVRSMPAYSDESTLNNQGGQDVASFLLGLID